MSEMATRVVARFAAAAGEVKKGDTLKVLSRRGQWPPDLYAKGSVMEVVDGAQVGGRITTKPKGSSMGGPHEFTISKAPKGTFKLESTRSGRQLKVQPV